MSELTSVRVTETVEKTYVELVQRALHEHGHSGYTGSIAESPDLTIVGHEATEDDALDAAELAFAGAGKYPAPEKWENTLAITYPHGVVFYGFYSS